MIDILPKKHAQFQDEAYWSKFFKDTQTSQGFEWYANYQELEFFLKTVMKKQDQKVLVPGCGNSELSEKLVQTLGMKDVLSIDFEQEVVKAMQEKQPEDTKAALKYAKMDMTDMKGVDSGSIGVVVDKGSFDAICSEDDEASKAKANAYLNEVFRVLSDQGGAFICVSLLQSFVFKALVDFINFGRENKQKDDHIFDFRVQRIDRYLKKDPQQSEFVPFFLTVRKTKIDTGNQAMKDLQKKLSDHITFIQHRMAPPMMLTAEHAIEKVKRDQISLMFAPQLKELRPGQRVEINAYDYKVSRVVPRYTFFVVDSNEKKILEKNTCACFITPQGRERDQMFSTENGNFTLSKQAGFSRLIVAHLNHGHFFQDLESVKNQLSQKVIELAPVDCANKNELPFLSIGSDIGKRYTTYRENGIIVEDYRVETNEVYRQVVFQSKLEQVQSEALLAYRNVKNQDEVFEVQTKLYPKKKQRIIAINHDYLCSEYQRAKMMGIGLAPASFGNKETKLNFLVLGTGAGLLTMFLQSQLKPFINKLDTIDNNPTMLKIAEQQFGFAPAKCTKSHCGDALTLVNGLQANFYNMIMMDINYEEGNDAISPPFKFMAPAYVSRLITLLKDEGLLTFNIICYDKEMLTKAVDTLKQSAGEGITVYFMHCESEMNYELYFVKGKGDFENRLENLKKFLKERSLNRGQWLTEMEMEEAITKIKPIDQLTGDEIKA